MALLVWLLVLIKGWFMGSASAVMFGHRRSILAHGDWLYISLDGGFHPRMFFGVGVVLRIGLVLLTVCYNFISWLWCNNLVGWAQGPHLHIFRPHGNCSRSICWYGHTMWMVVLVSFSLVGGFH